MGSYSNTYLGIYLEVPVAKVTVKTTIIVHPQTGKEMKTKFDPNNGIEGVEKSIEVVEDKHPCPYIQNVEGLDEDMFFAPAYSALPEKEGRTFILNTSDTKFGERVTGHRDVANLDMSNQSETPAQLIEDFKKEFKPYIDYFESQFGKLKVNYGVVVYYH